MGTPIQGTIFQMYDKETGANRRKRFPKTVIEAVLGLPSYLQDQFSALADIYMPIGGIYQSQTGQEFVYRATPNTIKAKSFTLDRIQGKSLAWNQYIDKDFTRNPTTSGVTRTTVGNHFHLQGTATSSGWGPVFNWTELIAVAGHKYLYLFRFSGQGASSLKIGDQYQGFAPSADSFIVLASLSGYMIAQSFLTNGVEYDCDAYINIIDLTLLYGTEINGLTDAEILAKYEADFGTGYHEYNAGKLISNDAESIETVGFNQWDEEWEEGSINSTTGEVVPANTRFRSKNFIQILPNTTYYCYYGNSEAVCFAWFYDKNKTFLANIGTVNITNEEFTTPASAEYMKICPYLGGNSYNHDICINLSDPAKNGTYEPYRKNTLNLGLNSFKVKDGQGNVTTITGGLKSAGSIYDEIVGNKLIKRVGEVDLGTLSYSVNNNVFRSPISDIKKSASTSSVANIISPIYTATTPIGVNSQDKTMASDESENKIAIKNTAYSDAASFKTAMSGVMLYYELATPIEYDLVEPLIYTMKAGTTEARISPNEDGLSAPFCCDMTYSASDNNDADNAQYAATAGRLLNSHKIWGQDFNGSEDVDGNLVSNGILQGTQLKSTAQTGTPPLVVSSTTTVANLVAEKASQLLTARTIWGRSFDGSGNISGALEGVTTISASGLATIAGGIALGTSTNAQAAKMIWDETNNAWHLQGSLYADGFITGGGLNDNSGSTPADAILAQTFEPTDEIFAKAFGLYDEEADVYYAIPSASAAFEDLSDSYILATRQWVIDNFEPKTA